MDDEKISTKNSKHHSSKHSSMSSKATTGTMASSLDNQSYFVEGAFTIMVCTYDEDVVSDYRLTVYSDYPLKSASVGDCGALCEIGESLPVMNESTPLELKPKMYSKNKKNRGKKGSRNNRSGKKGSRKNKSTKK